MSEVHTVQQRPWLLSGQCSLKHKQSPSQLDSQLWIPVTQPAHTPSYTACLTHSKPVSQPALMHSINWPARETVILHSEASREAHTNLQSSPTGKHELYLDPSPTGVVKSLLEKLIARTMDSAGNHYITWIKSYRRADTPGKLWAAGTQVEMDSTRNHTLPGIKSYRGAAITLDQC